MGLHSYFQKNMIPLESVMSKVWNKKIFSNIQQKADHASKILAEERGACPDAAEYNFNEGFQTKQQLHQLRQFQLFVVAHHPELNLSLQIVIHTKLFQDRIM